MGIRAAVLLYVACGCGRVAFDPVSDAGTLPDGACGWSAPAAVSPPDTPNNAEWHPWLAQSGLTLYFYQFTTNADLMVSTRASLTDPFSPGVLITELDTPSREAFPTVSADELTLIFDSDRGTTNQELLITTRATPTATWSAPVPIAALNTTASEEGAALMPDGLELFFERDTGTTHILVATRADTAQPFTSETEITEVAPPAGYRNHHATITPDGLTLYLSSNRPGGAGGYDVWTATRATRGAVFSAPVLVPELSSPGDDSVDSVSADGSTVYMAYNADYNGLADIYTATRSCR